MATCLTTGALVLGGTQAFAQVGTNPISGYRGTATLPEPVEAPISQLCARARSGEAEAMNQLAWAYHYGKGAERNDGFAAYLFYAAATQEHEGARRMLRSMSWPAAEIPPCLTEVPPPPPPEPALVRVEAPPHIDQIVRSLAPKYELDPLLVLAFIDVESNFNPFALSPKNAMGLMQLIPETSQRFGVRKPFDARDNIQGGMAYLRWLLAYFEGNLTWVAAAYNAGEGAVEKYRGVPPFAETQDYVRKVLSRVGSTRHPFDAKIASPSRLVRGDIKGPDAAPPPTTGTSKTNPESKPAVARKADEPTQRAAVATAQTTTAAQPTTAAPSTTPTRPTQPAQAKTPAQPTSPSAKSTAKPTPAPPPTNRFANADGVPVAE